MEFRCNHFVDMASRLIVVVSFPGVIALGAVFMEYGFGNEVLQRGGLVEPDRP
jgi:hypothetical protein